MISLKLKLPIFLLAVPLLANYRFYIGQFGMWGQQGKGPSAGVFGTAASANVDTRPIRSSRVLSERFIYFLLWGRTAFPMAPGKKCKECADSNTSSKVTR